MDLCTDYLGFMMRKQTHTGSVMEAKTISISLIIVGMIITAVVTVTIVTGNLFSYIYIYFYAFRKNCLRLT